jgi:hypothetical protein
MNFEIRGVRPGFVDLCGASDDGQVEWTHFFTVGEVNELVEKLLAAQVHATNLMKGKGPNDEH